MIRVLVVDASAEIRKILTEYLSYDPSITVVGVAPTIASAQRQIAKLKPDIITIHEDLNDELYLRTISQTAGDLEHIPIIILGTIDDATKQALSEAPHSRRGRPAPRRRRAIVCKTPQDRRFTEICKRIHQISQNQTALDSPLCTSGTVNKPQETITGAIGMAVSTGGPNALVRIFSELSPQITVPIVVTQHMPGQFTPLLVERLKNRSSLKIYEAHDLQIIEPGCVYVAPGDRHLTVARHDGNITIILDDGPKENSCRPSADVMFRSLAETFGDRALGIVLTGMGIDGQSGSHSVKKRGGTIIAQDEKSSTVWGMPKAVITAGLADEILSLDEIPQILNKRFSKRSLS